MQSVFPTAYFGNMAYFYELVNADQPVVDLHEHFVKQSLRTRCEILSANGPIQLTVPVIKPDGAKTLLKNITICNKTNWKLNHWRAIQSAYASSPYFEYYGIEIQQLLFNEYHNLWQLNHCLTETILNWLDIKLSLTYSNEYIISKSIHDFRNATFDHKNQSFKPYNQVFAQKENYLPNLSILDLILNEGPMARKWIRSN